MQPRETHVLHVDSAHDTLPLALTACTLQDVHTEGGGPHPTGFLHSGVYVMSALKSVFQTLRGGKEKVGRPSTFHSPVGLCPIPCYARLP